MISRKAIKEALSHNDFRYIPDALELIEKQERQIQSLITELHKERFYTQADMDAINEDRHRWQKEWYQIANECWWHEPKDGALPTTGKIVLVQLEERLFGYYLWLAVFDGKRFILQRNTAEALPKGVRFWRYVETMNDFADVKIC